MLFSPWNTRLFFFFLFILSLVVQFFWSFSIRSNLILSEINVTNVSSSSSSRFVNRNNSDLPLCEVVVKELLSKKKSFVVNVSRIVPRSFEELEKRLEKKVSFGGYSYPLDCREKESLALIVCYREREEHLKLFLEHFHQFLREQKLHYQIFVVNQHGREDFNRGSLFNIGFVQSLKIYPFECFIFHDIDLFPEDQRNLYYCHSNPQHLSVSIDKFRYKLLYQSLFGGATSFRREDFLRTNGYANIYWGWGNEDDDMFLRVTKQFNQTIRRYPLEIARYQMIRQFGHRTSLKNPHREEILHSKYSFQLDGLNNLQYHLHQLTLFPLFTLINVSLFQESFQHISLRLNLTRKTS